MTDREDGHNGGGNGISPWEWVSAVIGAILVFGTIGVMLHEAFTMSQRPVAVEITVDTIVPAPTGHLVRFTAHNRGDFTAATLQVEAELLRDDVVVESARTTIDYLPQRGSRSAAVIFEIDPREHTLRLRPVGHDDP